VDEDATGVGPRKHGGALWRHLLNTVEPFMCGGDVAFLSNYFDHLLNFGPRAVESLEWVNALQIWCAE